MIEDRRNGNEPDTQFAQAPHQRHGAAIESSAVQEATGVSIYDEDPPYFRAASAPALVGSCDWAASRRNFRPRNMLISRTRQVRVQPVPVRVPMIVPLGECVQNRTPIARLARGSSLRTSLIRAAHPWGRRACHLSGYSHGIAAGLQRESVPKVDGFGRHKHRQSHHSPFENISTGGIEARASLRLPVCLASTHGHLLEGPA